MNETAKAQEQSVRDENLYSQMDEIHQLLTNQQEWQKKMEHSMGKLSFRLKKFSVRHRKESKKTEKIGKKLDIIEVRLRKLVKLGDIEKKVHNACVHLRELEKKSDNIGRQIATMKEDLEGMTELAFEHMFTLVTKNRIKLEDSMTMAEDVADEIFMHNGRQYQFQRETKAKLDSLMKAVDPKLVNILKCRRCRKELPEDLQKNRDGVTSKCPQCHIDNIVVKLEEGKKWISIAACNEYHFQQISTGALVGRRATCVICGKTGRWMDMTKAMALQYWMT